MPGHSAPSCSSSYSCTSYDLTASRLFPRLVVNLGDERHIFDRAELMYTEVQEIEKVTGSSFAEWERELGRYSITVPATLCLRRGTLGS